MIHRVVLAAYCITLFAGLAVAQNFSTTTLTGITPTAPVFGQSVTLTAQVAPVTAQGIVAFMDGSVPIGVGQPNSSGIAQLTTIALSAGPHFIRAVYSGGTSFVSSQSSVIPYVVTALPGAGFSSAMNVDTDNDTSSLAVGDFNRDGIPDLVVGKFRHITVFLGNGNGTFQNRGSYSIMGDFVNSVAVGDFNGDGKLDLVVESVTFNEFCCVGEGEISVLLGNGDENGTFQNPIVVASATSASSFAVADFNGDGKLDLIAVTDRQFNIVRVMLGNGDGTFQIGSSYNLGDITAIRSIEGFSSFVGVEGVPPDALSVGDFNGDGTSDVAVAIFGPDGSYVIVMQGNPDGTFHVGDSDLQYGGISPYALSVADLNGDGLTDLVVANIESYISVLLGKGNGGFPNLVDYLAGIYPDFVTAGDFNGDGRTDLAVTNFSSGGLSVLLGNGDGTLQSPAYYAVGAHPLSAVVADFNGDGRADLAVVDQAGGVKVLLATPPPLTSLALTASSGSSQLGQPVTLTADITPTNSTGHVEFLDGTTVLGIGTLNLAGRAQITTRMLASGSRSLSAVYEGDPGYWDRSSSNVVSHVVRAISTTGLVAANSLNSGANPDAIALGYLNNDSNADVVVANFSSANVSVMLGNGNGTFQTAANYTTGSNPAHVVLGDLDGDGIVDLVVANYGSNTVSVLIGKGDGTFKGKVDYAVGNSPARVTLADFNKDGKIDMAVANRNGGDVSVLIGNGDGTFAKTIPFAAGAGPLSIVSGDFNRDGNPDLAVANYDGGNVSVLFGNGNGTFQLPVNYASGAGPTSIATSDFNGDAYLDLVVTNSGNADASVLLGNVDGTFQPAANYITGANPNFVTLGDFNGDGKTDLATANFDDNTITILYGNGNGTFQVPTNTSTFGTGTNPIAIAVGDLNGDGRSDIAIANYGGGDVSVFLAAVTPTNTLTISKIGTGIGTVTTSPSDIDCGATCSMPFSSGQVVVLTATANTGSIFRGWSGDADCADGNVTMSAAHNCAARFDLLHNDFNGDGKTDVMWQNADGSSAIWLMDGMNVISGAGLIGPGTGWRVKQLGDFNVDGKTDIVWQNADGSSAIWLMNGLSVISGGGLIGPGTGWSVKAIGDFNGDGKSDIVWQNTDGSSAIWLMNGLNVTSGGGLIGPGTGWSVKAIGDFNGDGKSDLIWQHTDGRSAIWLMNGLNVSNSGGLRGPGTGWGVDQVGDFNGDGKSDVVWQNIVGGSEVWLMDGLSLSSGGSLLGPATGWSVNLIGDFNGDGKSDVLWQHTDGSSAIWLMDGLSVISGGGILGSGTGWNVKQIGDFNGDGKSDVAWEHTDGRSAIWLMDGLSALSGEGLLGSGSGWSLLLP